MLKIKAGNSTPEVKISVEDCIFEINGLSFSNDADNFYKPVLKYIEENFPKLECEINCKFNLTVFNSVTYKYVLSMMNKFMQYNKEGKKIRITWYYESEDEDNKESASDISSLFNIPFELKEI